MKKAIVLTLFLTTTWMLRAETLEIYVPGMVCPMCLVGIQKQFKNDVKHLQDDVRLDLDKKIVTVRTEKKLTDKEIKQKIKDSGYKAESIKRIEDKNADSAEKK